MTQKQRFIDALKCRKIRGHVPHFELVFFLTMEKFGILHPSHRLFKQWDQMSRREQLLHIKDIAKAYILPAQTYNHSAIFLQNSAEDFDFISQVIKEIRYATGDEYFIMLHGDPTFSIPNGSDMVEFSAQMYEEPEMLKERAKKRFNAMASAVEICSKEKGLIDGFCLCSDYAFNTAPFFSEEMFDEFIYPYLREITRVMHELGFYVIKHSDGNIKPIFRKIVESGVDAVHSIDPQGGMDLKTLKKEYEGKLCLIGNVNCGLLQTGTDEEAEADIRRSLNEGMEGYGYIFSTSNCIYTGMPLERYELMHSIWLKEGIYK